MLLWKPDIDREDVLPKGKKNIHYNDEHYRSYRDWQFLYSKRLYHTMTCLKPELTSVQICTGVSTIPHGGKDAMCISLQNQDLGLLNMHI